MQLSKPLTLASKSAVRADILRGAGLAFSVAPSGVDAADGFVHFSSAAQVSETLDKHYAEAGDLVLLAVDTHGLEDLRWEASRGGDLFPHLYGSLAEAMVVQEFALNRTRDGMSAWLQAMDLESQT